MAGTEASTAKVQVDPSNADAFAAWDGGDGDHWAANEAIYDVCLRGYRAPFFEAASIDASDRVLDVGCGTGDTTRDAARRATAGSALGVDLSSRMLAVARQRAREQGLANADFVQADAQVHPFEPATFDVAISRTGAMFFGDAQAAFSNIGHALRPGGRLVLLVWRSLPENHWVRDFRAALAAGRELPAPPPGAPGPFSLSDPGHVRHLLASAGLGDVALEAVDQPMWFGATAGAAYDFIRHQGFTEFMLRDLDEPRREQALRDLRASIDAHAGADGVEYPSAAWIITAARPL